MDMLTRLAEDTVDIGRKGEKTRRVNGQTLINSATRSATDGKINRQSSEVTVKLSALVPPFPMKCPPWWCLLFLFLSFPVRAEARDPVMTCWSANSLT